MKKYLIVIETGPDNYSAFSPDVPDVSTTGKTVEETLVNMREAIAGHIMLMDEIPKPKGLNYHLANGEFAPSKLEEHYFITTVLMEQGTIQSKLI